MVKANLKYCTQVDGSKYKETYVKMKAKHAHYLIQNWTERTDPLKFVHEDIAIASYLLLLWKDKICNFVDLGCGNGLLVYLLTQEGHRGIGLDVRKRKIWDFYPESTVLKEKTVIPSSKSVYPEADWLIGNHSDELTAWLPIMAARSNDSCNFFTIPCCPYELSGAKFQRKQANMSSYQDFLEYVEKVGDLCGFETTADKLRIPSTKRICLIGRRNEPRNNVNEAIDRFLQNECPSNEFDQNDMWIGKFVPREAIEPVKNCTKIPKEIQHKLIKLIFTILLNAGESKKNGDDWNHGGNVHISDLATRLPQDMLTILKSECRGLQTFLKNHHQIFFVNCGWVSLRNNDMLKKLSANTKERNDFKWKSKECWFHSHHPQGCPIEEIECSYSHTIKNNQLS